MRSIGDLVYFNVLCAGCELHYKLPFTKPLRMMFQKSGIRSDFIWNGIVLDGDLAPIHYNMIPGEENVVTLSASEEAIVSHKEFSVPDVRRAYAFRLRIADERIEALSQELEAAEQSKRSVSEQLTTMKATYEASLAALRRRITELENPPPTVTQTVERISIRCVVLDDASGSEHTLNPIEMTKRSTVGAAYEAFSMKNSGIVPELSSCMLCIKNAISGSYAVIDVTDRASLATPLEHDDTVFVARTQEM